MIDFPTYMKGLLNAPFDISKCDTCGGLGVVPVMCCSGLPNECGCMGMPIDFTGCLNCSCEEPKEDLIEKWAKEVNL